MFELKPGDAGYEDWKKDKDEGEATSKKLKDTVEKLTTASTARDGEFATLNTRVSDAENALLDPDYLDFISGKKPTKEIAAMTEGKEFDDMTSAEKNNFFKKIVSDAITASAKPLIDRLGKIEGSVDMQGAASQVQTFIDGKVDGEKHSDFWNFKKEMKADSDKHPTLGVADLYQRAKAKFLKQQEKDRVEELPETEKPGTSIEVLQEKKLNKDEAFEAAYRKTHSEKTKE